MGVVGFEISLWILVWLYCVDMMKEKALVSNWFWFIKVSELLSFVESWTIFVVCAGE